MSGIISATNFSLTMKIAYTVIEIPYNKNKMNDKFKPTEFYKKFPVYSTNY